MELKNDGVFEEFSVQKEVPASATNAEGGISTTSIRGEELPPVKLPFPEKDYNKKGELKKVRGRMLKKLLKSEFKHYLPLTLCFMGLLLLTSIFCGVGLRKMVFLDETTNTPFFDIVSLTSILLFIGCCVGAAVFTAVYPIARYEKNFFQNEGYLTFSVPASMEEHVLAKRIMAVLCTCAMAIVLILSIVLALVIGGLAWFEEGFFGEQIFAFQNDAYMKGGHAVAYIIESILSALVGAVMLPSVYGVFTCLFSKLAGKRKTGFVILLIFLAVGIFDSLSASFLTGARESLFPQTAAWAHILCWLGIVAQAAITVGCVCFEVWFLKRKLDLK